MTAEQIRVSPSWLAMREPADAAARSGELVDMVRDQFAGGPLVIHDLGSGTGSMCRWLAPRLPQPQHWVMYDRDRDLLDLALADLPISAGVTAEVRESDITQLTRADLAGATLITASALLDMLTAEEIARVVTASAGTPALFTLTVIGQIAIAPADERDDTVMAAFNEHQRRTVGGRALMGPDAVAATIEAFERCGATVLTRPSPWRLGRDQAELAAQWLDGWLAPAFEQRPELVDTATAYAATRRAAAEAGHLDIVVHHTDLLAY